MNKKSELSKYVILITLLSSCTPPTPEEERKAYNKKLGSQGEVTATHLFIRSPGNARGLPPVTLKIPREYLANTPVYKTPDKDEIQKVYFQFKAPEGTPWKDLPPMPFERDEKKLAEGRAYYDKQVFVIMDMNASGSGVEYYREKGKNKKYYWPDTQIAGLDRYTPYDCYNETQLNIPSNKTWLQQKELDDSTPENCRLNRGFYYLVTPESITNDKNEVAMICSGGSCSAYFQAAKRKVNIDIRDAFLPQWKQRVDIACQLANGFVVDK